MLRPIRVGLVAEATLDSVKEAVGLATTAWGGCYFPILPADDIDAQRAMARGLGVDVVVGVAGVHTPISDEPGFQWRGYNAWGPFAEPDGMLAVRVLDIGAYLRARADRNGNLDLFRPTWHEAEPLEALFAAWHGRFPTTDNGQGLAQYFKQPAQGYFELSATLPVPSGTTPIEATALDIACHAIDTSAGVVVVDPTDPVELIGFWNLRAAGHPVFPWPTEAGSGFVTALLAWVDSVRNQLSRWRRGDGLEGESLYVFSHSGIPDALAEALADENFDLQLRPPHPWLDGWRGSHPLQTPFVNIFRVSVARDERTVDIALPSIPSVGASIEGWWRPGTVAAQVDFHTVEGLPPGYTASLPNVRSLATVLTAYVDWPEQFHRPASDGRVAAVPADADSVTLRLIPTEDLYSELLAGEGVECGRTSNGRFSTRLIDLLGGIESPAANQPAVREVLVRAASSMAGRPIGALISYGNDRKGDWPGPLLEHRVGQDYVPRIVRWLASIRVLRPYLPVRCPACTTETSYSPEELATSLRCSFCDEEYALGLALSARQRTDWLYRLAGSIPVERLRETLPVMAAMHLLAGYQSGTTPPYVLGFAIKESGDEREVDLLVSLDDHGVPVVVAGEAKSHRDCIDSSDLEYLSLLQSRLRARGLEAFVLYATLRAELKPSERTLLREVANNAPGTLHYRSGPPIALPIVLTEGDLSRQRFLPGDPLIGVSSVADLAVTMCERNLGLAGIEYEGRPGAAPRLKLVWSDS